MASDPPDQEHLQAQQLFVRADEVDSGTTILSPSREVPLSALSPADGAPSGARPKAPPRPGLKREGTAPPPPPPPSQPPPAPPPQPDPTDSLSLPQLRQLVGQFPKPEQRAYAFRYKDAEDFEPEVDEWFHYTEIEQDRDYLLAAREVFEQRWKFFCQQQHISEETTWINLPHARQQQFLSELRAQLSDKEYSSREEALSCVFYILTGVWSVTSGLEPTDVAGDGGNASLPENDHFNAVQVQWMHKGADAVQQNHIIPQLYACLIQAARAPDDPRPSQNPDGEEVNEGAFGEKGYQEISLCLSAFFILIESARVRIGTPSGKGLRDAIVALQPNFLVFLVSMISRLRWDESYNIPLMHALQLFWKALLVVFGDLTGYLDKIKGVLQPRVDPFSSEASRPVLTASPLDYHLFRQEITSKYPAYNPPLPLIPLEIEQKTMLPPLPSQPRQENFPGAPGPGLSGATPRGSIFHQPVHIATPAPSPPPSPVGPGGKAAKKQNYQTNQNFPFLYPPLDSSSNTIGGKGSSEIQDLMVGKKWEGSDVPLSIIEAGELFASRMRMTRAMRQLWKQRDLFMKFERGWGADESGSKEANADDELESLDTELRSRMYAVDEFFRQALPDLQSLIIVMMKVMLTNVQDIAVRNGGLQETTQPGGLNRTKSNSNIAQNPALPIPPPPPRPAEMALEDLDNVRSREISQKAVSGAIFLLLKWFKVSHVLKFEYLTQLLLDSNYIQLTLKYFAHQNLEDLVAFKYDRDDLSMWHYCHVHSDHPPLSPTSPDERSETSSVDDAIPPPISRHRRSPSAKLDDQGSSDQGSTLQGSDGQARPSVDELGNPLGPLPAEPITTFSFRQFQTAIHLLRALQKVTRGKSHRILFLVQFKSSQILRRVLRVPDPTLRLYVLKLFKSQVPYCGRKWRQSNMRVITAIYLHCRPELRDEWLAGMHDANVEGEVDEAVPLEWALRGLTFWWQKRVYPGVMRKVKRGGKGKGKNQSLASALDKLVAAEGLTEGSHGKEVDLENIDIQIPDETLDNIEDVDEEDEGGQEIDDDERDFFRRELDAIGWGLAGVRLGDGEEVAFGEEAIGVNGAGPVAYSNVNGATGTGMDTSLSHGSVAGGGLSTGMPQTSVTQPQWITANAASLENWQNS
ncbi:Factor arrest protein 11 [Elasticomyces elasticus]|uniref:Factor arrest protein 11 n=1 Tax=Exophiala sideris TaxID=1016849 RepID=A0ABR0JNA1_9EURO|nr:Factor arrest protein 11 [Elasticomyces elasticus]KAK5037984.1 Factor arrest protein 11 [Exophiala sideris]KAK5043966.1 Factor arrest protein 11 [Exophiala sideris]KAK5067465.1 Factor arrest protein 11 [Exophiala sideris]KAK5184299.1 Factor arrest protein 11 [Eurotiomycetes sp. CCFEE 6388]